MSRQRDCTACDGQGHHENPDEEEAALNPSALVTCYACGGTGIEPLPLPASATDTIDKPELPPVGEIERF